MKDVKLTLSILPDKFAICRLKANAPVPEWIEGNSLISITRTEEELSIVCPDEMVPDGIKSEKGWKAFKLEGPIDFSVTGILASLANPLASAEIPIFAISTFDTDYLLVKEHDFQNALSVLKHYFNIAE